MHQAPKGDNGGKREDTRRVLCILDRARYSFVSPSSNGAFCNRPTTGGVADAFCQLDRDNGRRIGKPGDSQLTAVVSGFGVGVREVRAHFCFDDDCGGGVCVLSGAFFRTSRLKGDLRIRGS